jgi:hypothetical protein
MARGQRVLRMPPVTYKQKRPEPQFRTLGNLPRTAQTTLRYQKGLWCKCHHGMQPGAGVAVRGAAFCLRLQPRSGGRLLSPAAALEVVQISSPAVPTVPFRGSETDARDVGFSFSSRDSGLYRASLSELEGGKTYLHFRPPRRRTGCGKRPERALPTGTICHAAGIK